MAESAAGNRKRILRSDWLSKRTRSAHLASLVTSRVCPTRKSSLFVHIANPLLTKCEVKMARDFLRLSRQKKFPFVHITNPLLTKREVKMAGYWPRFSIYFVSVKKTQRSWPIPSHLDLTLGR